MNESGDRLPETSNFELPKLPQLNEDDVKAVRGFLPGKLLGRTAAILSLVLLVLGFSGAVGKGLQYLFNVDLPWWGYAILLALALLAVVAQVLSEWLSERNRQAKQKLAVQTGTQQTGYFRIGPYQDTEIDRARFSRPDRAEEKALDWIRKSSHLPLYFTGDSGSGKSSLLNASLLPKLREEGWTVVEARAWQDPLGAIRDALQKLSNGRRGKAAKEPTLGEMIQQAAKRASDKLLIVLDQFEEFLILASPERQGEFAAFVSEMQSSPLKKPWLLLVLRSDYQTLLEESGLPPLRAGENLFQLGRFQFAAAAEFMKKSGLDLQPEALQSLLTSAAVLDDTPGLVRPITLNVTGYILASGAPVAPSLEAGTLVRTYIEQTVQQPGLRDGGPQLLEHLITEQGTKQPRSEKDLANAAKLRAAEVRAILNGLSDAGLARPLDAARGVWELSHDFIAHAVARFLGRLRGDLRRHALAYAAPALLAMILTVGVGAAVWEQSSIARIRAELSGLGVTTSVHTDGLHAIVPIDVDDGKLLVIGSELARLPNLSSLDFSPAKQITDLEPLKGLTALQRLDLTGTQAANLEPLKGLTALQVLDLTGAQAANLEPLKGLTALQTLYLSGTQAANLEPLKGLTALQTLYLGSTQAANLEPLKGLTALQRLDLGSTQAANLEPLKGLTALQTLYLSGTPVANLEPLKGLTALQTLYLSGTPVANLEPLKGLTALQTLYLSGTPVANLEPLKGLTALQTLYLFLGTPVANLEPLKGLTALQRLDLTGTQAANLEPLKGLTALQRLDLTGTQAANLEPLKGLTALQTLYLSGTPVANLEPLKGLTALQTLDLGGTQAANLEPLRGLTALQWLDLPGTRVKNLEPIYDLPNLKVLGIAEPLKTQFVQYRKAKGLAYEE